MRTSKTSWQQRQSKCVLALFATVLAAVGNITAGGTPAQAQSFSYWPWAIGSSLIYPLRYLGYSAYGNSGYGNPGWVGGSILQRATRGYGGMGYSGYSPYGNPNFANVNNNAQGNTSTAPGVLKYGGYPNNQNQNQNQNTNQNQPQNSSNVTNNGSTNGQSATGYPQTQPGQQQDPNAIYPSPVPQMGTTAGVGNYSNSNYPVNAPLQQYASGQGSVGMSQGNFGMAQGNPNMPQGNQPGVNSGSGKHHKSKDKNKNHDSNLASGSSGPNSSSNSNGIGGQNGYGSGAANSTRNQSMPGSPGMAGGAGAATAPVTSAAAAPFAVAFINNVNTEYHGDIRKALSNSQTRAWAQSLGIADQGNFAISDERSGIIERVLKDNALDPVSKLDTVKILLRN